MRSYTTIPIIVRVYPSTFVIVPRNGWLGMPVQHTPQRIPSDGQFSIPNDSQSSIPRNSWLGIPGSGYPTITGSRIQCCPMSTLNRTNSHIVYQVRFDIVTSRQFSAQVLSYHLDHLQPGIRTICSWELLSSFGPFSRQASGHVRQASGHCSPGIVPT